MKGRKRFLLLRRRLAEASTTKKKRKSLLLGLCLSLRFPPSLARGSLRCVLSSAGSPEKSLPVPLARRKGEESRPLQQEAGPTAASRETSSLRRFSFLRSFFVLYEANKPEKKKKKKTLFCSRSIFLFLKKKMLSSLLCSSLRRSREAASLVTSCSERILTSIGGTKRGANTGVFSLSSFLKLQKQKLTFFSLRPLLPL